VSEADKASDFDKFEEYKLFVEDTAHFSERRQAVSSTYVAVNSIILGAVALLVKDVDVSAPWRVLAVIPVLVAGIVICLQWKQLILKYKVLISLRLDQLRAIEKLPAMAASAKMYHAEDRLYPRNERGEVKPGEGLNLSDLEQWLPLVFIALYALFLAGVAALLVVGVFTPPQ